MGGGRLAREEGTCEMGFDSWCIECPGNLRMNGQMDGWTGG